MWTRADLKSWSSRIKRDVLALYLALQDPRVPILVKCLAVLIVAYALSPIDLIPDFVPVLGYVDDLLLLPLGIWLAVRLIPQDVLQDLRSRAVSRIETGRLRWMGAALVVTSWVLILITIMWWMSST